MYLPFDTETTGVPKFDLPVDHPQQPHILQLGMILCDENGREVQVHKVPIKPEGFEVDERLVGDDGKKTAFAVNGLSNAFLNRYGVPLKEALGLFRSLEEKAELKIAHSYRFDGFLLKTAHARAGVEPLFPAINKYCTMKAIADIRGSKWPKLVDIYKELTGKEPIDAHDALADVRMCKDVFFWIKANGLYREQPRVGPATEAA